MRLLLSAAVLLLAAVMPAAQAQQSPASSLVALPDCARECLVQAILASPCLATNQTCICLDNKLQTAATACVTAKCTVKEALFTMNTTSTACGAPIRDKRQELNTVAITLGSLSGVFVLMRILARLLIIGGPLGADDWFIVATLVAGIPNTVMVVHGVVASGLGLDIWTLPFDEITEFGRWFFVLEVVYFVLLSLTKMSLLFFYLRIFPTKGIRRLLWGTVAFNAVYAFVFVIVGIFQCTPVQFFWERWDGEHKGRCLDINGIAWANAAISIALDLWMLALPLSQLGTLKLHWKKKVGVGMMFGVGTFVTVVSILRLQSMVAFGNSNNPTMDHWDVTNWSTIEINTGIMCACLPSLRLLLVRAFPRLGGSTGRYGSKAGRYYDAGGRGPSKNLTGGGGPAGEAVELGNTPTGGRKDQQHSRQGSRARELGVNSTVGRGSSSDDLDAAAAAKGGISYSRTYEVSYGDDQDEESLVGSQNNSRGGAGRPEIRRKATLDEDEYYADERGVRPVTPGHGYHRRFQTTSSKASTIGSSSVEKIPDHV